MNKVSVKLALQVVPSAQTESVSNAQLGIFHLTLLFPTYSNQICNALAYALLEHM